jgi:hypothetical protein
MPRTTKIQKKNTNGKRIGEKTYNANPITVNSRVNLLAVLRRRIDNGLARARFRSGRHLFFFAFASFGVDLVVEIPFFFPLFSSLSLSLARGSRWWVNRRLVWQ